MKSLNLLVANLVLRTSSGAAYAIPQPLHKGAAPKPAREKLPMTSLNLLVANLVLITSSAAAFQILEPLPKGGGS